jgi:hypothetical protein
MNDLLNQQNSLVDEIAETAFIRGKLTARSEVYQQFKDAYNSEKIGTTAYIAILQILNEEK